MARTKTGKRIEAEVLEQEYEVVAVKELQEHPRNPRKGAVEAIDESVDINGWYGAVVAQKSTGHILAGNHRYRVAKKRGAMRIPVIWKDVDDETALRILLADNKTADLGGYDEALLDEIMSGLENLDGTGWGLEHVQAQEEAEAEAEVAGPVDPEDVPEDKYTPSYGVIVVCKDESDQEEVYAYLADLIENAKDGMPWEIALRVVAV